MDAISAPDPAFGDADGGADSDRHAEVVHVRLAWLDACKLRSACRIDGLEDWWGHSDLDGLLPPASTASAAADATACAAHGDASADGSACGLKRRPSGSAASGGAPEKRARTGSSSLELSEAAGDDEYDFGAFYKEEPSADGVQPGVALAER